MNFQEKALKKALDKKLSRFNEIQAKKLNLAVKQTML